MAVPYQARYKVVYKSNKELKDERSLKSSHMLAKQFCADTARLRIRICCNRTLVISSAPICHADLISDRKCASFASIMLALPACREERSTRRLLKNADNKAC